MFLFEVKRLIWSALEIEFFELYFLQPVLGVHPVTARFDCIIFLFHGWFRKWKDKTNAVFWLATRAGKEGLFYPLRILCLVPERAFWFVRIGDHYADAIVYILAH